MKKTKFMVLASAALMFSLSACGPDGNPDGSGDENTSLDIEDTKEYVSSVAEDLVAKLDNPQSRELIELIQYLTSNYGDAEVNDSYPMRNISRSGDLYDLSTQPNNGIYEYQNGEWVNVGPSNKIVFQMNDNRYGTITYTVTRSSETDNINDGESFSAIVPRTIVAELRANNKLMLTQTVNSRLDQRGASVNVEEKTIGGGIEFITTLTGNNTTATFNETLMVVGETVSVATGTIKGNGLCDVTAIDNASEYDRPYDVIKSATVNCDILDKIQMRGNLNYTKPFYDASVSSFDYGRYDDYATASAASAACDRAIEVINNHFTADIYFNGSSNVQASVVFVKDGDSYTNGYGNTYGWYELVPAIKFADGSTYTDEYFEGIFDRAIKKWEMLFN